MLTEKVSVTTTPPPPMRLVIVDGLPTTAPPRTAPAHLRRCCKNHHSLCPRESALQVFSLAARNGFRSLDKWDSCGTDVTGL